jgi:Helix-turn-helix.
MRNQRNSLRRKQRLDIWIKKHYTNRIRPFKSVIPITFPVYFQIPNISDNTIPIFINNSINYDELSRITDTPAQTLNRYVLGQRIPKIDAATELAEKLNINPLWLQGYDVSIQSSKENDSSDISEEINGVLDKLVAQPEGLMFCGKPMDDETKHLLKLSLEHAMKLAIEMDKNKTD